VVLLAEANVLVQSRPATVGQAARTDFGLSTLLQADYEVVQGVHLMGTAETLQPDLSTDGPSLGGWASAAWFFAPHADVRADAVYQSFAGAQRLGVTSLLAQLHFFL